MKKNQSPRLALDEWARRNFDPPPHINTLRRWARDGLIFPQPTKIGRSYMVRPLAEYAKKKREPQ